MAMSISRGGAGADGGQGEAVIWATGAGGACASAAIGTPRPTAPRSANLHSRMVIKTPAPPRRQRGKVFSFGATIASGEHCRSGRIQAGNGHRTPLSRGVLNQMPAMPIQADWDYRLS